VTTRGAVLAVARHELRRRWRALVALGFVAGLVAAMVLSTVTLLRRTATASDRLEHATHAEDARVSAYNGPTPPPEVARLPGVAKAEVARVAVGAVEGRGQVIYTAITALDHFDGDLFTPVIVGGRAPDPHRADEIVVAESLARDNGIKVGYTFSIHMLTLDQVRHFDSGFGEPAGPVLHLHVVGLARLASLDSSNSGLIAGPAFARTLPPELFGSVVIVRLRHGTSDVPAFASALDRLAKRLYPATDVFVPLQPSYPSQGRPRVAATTGVLVSGLALIAVVSSLAGLVVFGQAAVRLFASGATDQQIEAALGLTPGERVAARVLPACLSAAIAAVVAVAASVAAGVLEPLGALRRLEPHPGWSPNWTVSILGGLCAVAIVLGTCALAARRAGTRRTAGVDVRRSAVARLASSTRRAWTAAGMAFVFGAAGNRRGSTLRAVVVGIVVGVTGIVAALVFVASLDRLTSTPARYGWIADFKVADANNAANHPTVERLVRDPNVAAVTISDFSVVRIGKVDVSGYALEHTRGRLGWTVIDGRMPTNDDEVMLGSQLARQLHRSVGDTVAGTGRGGTSVTLHVVGVGLGVDLQGERLGRQALLTKPMLTRIGQSDLQSDALIGMRRGVDAPAFASALGRTVEVEQPSQPPDVQNLAEIGRLPDVLAAFLGLLALSALLHGLVATVRRRRRDLGVLRAVGLTPREARGSVVTAALTITAIGLVFGVPLGFALGRLVWTAVAGATGVAGDPAVPWLGLVVVVPAALLAALAVAIVPGRRASRLAPAVVLRTE
jgi:ABC-type lipoprotein release transport system permease subunit